jgi:hypothetical protein
MVRVLGFDSWQGLGIFLFTTASMMALGPTQPAIQGVPGSLSLGVKQVGHEADHSPPSSAEVKECMNLYLYSPNTPSWHGAQLKKSTGTTLPLPLVTGCRLNKCSIPAGTEFFPFVMVSRLSLWLTQPPTKWISETFPRGKEVRI